MTDEQTIDQGHTYLELAKAQYIALRKEILDEDRHALGSLNEQSYEENGIKFKIEVDGFWESSYWFDYTVYDNTEEILDKGNYMF